MSLTRRDNVWDALDMNDLLTYAEAAEKLSVSRSTLYRMVADGMLTPVYVQVTPRSTAPRLKASEVAEHVTSAA